PSTHTTHHLMVYGNEVQAHTHTHTHTHQVILHRPAQKHKHTNTAKAILKAAPKNSCPSLPCSQLTHTHTHTHTHKHTLERMGTHTYTAIVLTFSLLIDLCTPRTLCVFIVFLS